MRTAVAPDRKYRAMPSETDDEPSPMASLKAKQKLHRETLIEATMQCIAEVGLDATTVTKIMKRAGLSRGMLHLYFASKDDLLVATAEHFSKEYYRKLQTFLDEAGSDPVERLFAMIDADLSEEILNLETVVVWAALRSAAHTNARIRGFTTTRDRSLQSMYEAIYDEILGANNDDPTKASELANGTIALLEGMWSDFFLYRDTFNRAKARRIVLRLIRGQVPLGDRE